MIRRPFSLLAGLAVTSLVLCVGLIAIGAAPLWSAGSSALPDSPDQPGVARSSPVAVELLQAAARASSRLTYSGSTSVQESGPAGNSLTQVRVWHRPGQGTSMVVVVDGRPVRSEWIPEGALGVPTVPEVLEVGVSETSLLATNYQVVLGGTGWVAGRPTREVLALRDDGSVAAAYQVDRGTGLLLAREAYASQWVRAEFSIIHFGQAGPATSSAVAVASMSKLALGRMRLAGWICRDRLPGGFRLFDVKVERYDGAATLHLIYSDGLATLSLFEQTGHLDPRHLTGFSQGSVGTATVWWRSGPLAQRVWQSGGLVVTVMGEVPTAVLEGVVEVIPGSRVDDGVKTSDRLRRGVHRVLTALGLTADAL